MNTFTIHYITKDSEFKSTSIKGKDLSEALKEFKKGTYYLKIVGIFTN